MLRSPGRSLSFKELGRMTGFSRQSLKPPRELKVDSNTGMLVWQHPTDSLPVTHYLVYADNESNLVAVVNFPQAFLPVFTASRVFVSSYNLPNHSESSKVLLGGPFSAERDLIMTFNVVEDAGFTIDWSPYGEIASRSSNAVATPLALYASCRNYSLTTDTLIQVFYSTDVSIADPADRVWNQMFAQLPTDERPMIPAGMDQLLVVPHTSFSGVTSPLPVGTLVRLGLNYTDGQPPLASDAELTINIVFRMA